MDYNNSYDMMNFLDDINSIIQELEMKTSFIRKTPDEIMKNEDFIEMKREQVRFELLNEMLVLPLKELANRISDRPNILPFDMSQLDKLSIMGRVMKLRTYLMSKGCTIQTIEQLIPKTEEEFDILLNAKKLGFNLGFDKNQPLDNKSRISRAQTYLEQVSVDSNYDESARKSK